MFLHKWIKIKPKTHPVDFEIRAGQHQADVSCHHFHRHQQPRLRPNPSRCCMSWVSPRFSSILQPRRTDSIPTSWSFSHRSVCKHPSNNKTYFVAYCCILHSVSSQKHIWGGINITYPLVTDVGSLLKPRSTDDARENEAWPRVGKEVGRSMEDLVPGTDPRNSPVLWRLMFVCLTCSIDGENFTSNNNVNDTRWNSFQNPNPHKFPVSVST